MSVELDAQRITQAVLALADNASHHTEPGDRIGLGTQFSDRELRFWVSDTGSGIDPADQAVIFDRFARGDSGSVRSEGAGLGLSIVRAIAVAHGGRVTVGSVPGQGSTFTVTVPVEPVATGPDAAGEYP